MRKRVYLYAFDFLCRIVDCKFLEGEAITVANMRRLANWMAESYPSQVTIWAVDNRPGLYKEFREAIDLKDFTNQLIFADTVSHEGIQIR